MKKKLPTLILVLVFIAGLSLLLYPTVSDWWNSIYQSRAIADYSETVEKMGDSECRALLDSARKYNESLAYESAGFGRAPKNGGQYSDMLSISDSGMMGYIEIPSIGVKLPIYHGTESRVLLSGVGHLEGTSLPVGGESSHCVLSGHRGLPSSRLFTDLDKLSEGDIFTLYVLNETLNYEVDQIRTVEPHEIGELVISSGQDYCTLVTCTPYGINSHRLLVRGHRVENVDGGAARVLSDAVLIDPLHTVPLFAAPILIVLFAFLLFRSKNKRANVSFNDNSDGEVVQ